MEMIFGKRIKDTRKAKSMTQAQLAEKTGFSQPTVADWEAGKKQPTAGAIIALCKALEVSADYLLGLSDN